jgi:hypothetical protein
VTSLKEYIARSGRTRRTPRTARRPMREDVGEVRVMSSPGLNAASVALPADVDLDDRATHLNEFWRALVEFQHRDVIVVALCVGEDQKHPSHSAMSAMPQ